MPEGCVMVAPGAKGSFPSSTDDATKPKNIIALSNPHTKTTGFQGTRIRIAEPPGTNSGLGLPLLYGEERQTYFMKILLCDSQPHRSGFIGSQWRRVCCAISSVTNKSSYTYRVSNPEFDKLFQNIWGMA
jgi:hypothetical protein